MSPELQRRVEELESKAKRGIDPRDRVLAALREAGALQAVAQLLEHDQVVKAEALEELARVKTEHRK
jgi:hypothetical protein